MVVSDWDVSDWDEAGGDPSCGVMDPRLRGDDEFKCGRGRIAPPQMNTIS